MVSSSRFDCVLAKTGECTGVPKGELSEFKSPLNFHNLFGIVCLQNILSKLCSYTHYILNLLQENVKNINTLISRFASASGGLHPDTSTPHTRTLPLDPSGGFHPPGPLTWPHHVNSHHCKIMGTPMGELP